MHYPYSQSQVDEARQIRPFFPPKFIQQRIAFMCDHGVVFERALSLNGVSITPQTTDVVGQWIPGSEAKPNG